MVVFSVADTRRTAGPLPICHLFGADEGVGSNNLCQSCRALATSIAPMMTSFTSTTPSGPPPLASNCLRTYRGVGRAIRVRERNDHDETEACRRKCSGVTFGHT
jgi:hypothetical protein